MVSVAAMVVYGDNKASTYSRCGKSGVAIAVLTHAVNDLDDSFRSIGWRPKLNMYVMPVAGIECQAFVLRFNHPFSISSAFQQTYRTRTR